MAKMIRLDPCPKEPLPTSGWELIATEAGRYSTGLRATVQVWNGDLQGARQLALADPQTWDDFATPLAAQMGVTTAEITTLILHLAAGVEGVLRQAEAASEARASSQATDLVELASGAELFHDPSGEAYATIEVDGHKETWLIKTKGFRRWLARQYYQVSEKAPGSQAVQDALGVLEGKALFDGRELPVYLRLAGHDGAIYLDLTNESWEAIEITRNGWKIVPTPPVKFRRTRGMLPLPHPVCGGTIEDLQAFVNVSTDNDNDWALIVAWLIAAFRPRGPYPVLTLHGEQGTAKSTTARVLRALVDPNSASLRADPRDAHDLVIAANNGWVICLDNLSHLPPWLSDAICRLATGGGFATRELYSDSDEVLFDAQRPVILNGIEELATRGDLLDRSILQNLPTIPDDQRKAEVELWADFEKKRPEILGAVLDVISSALRRLDDITHERLPRMADFARWAMAAEQALGWTQGTFTAAYEENRQSANQVSLEASLIASPLQALVQHKLWTGSATELLTALRGYVDEPTHKERHWPKNGKVLSDMLRRLAPNLRGIGVDVEFDKSNGARRIRIEKRD
jgi:hypothetical protein